MLALVCNLPPEAPTTPFLHQHPSTIFPHARNLVHHAPRSNRLSCASTNHLSIDPPTLTPAKHEAVDLGATHANAYTARVNSWDIYNYASITKTTTETEHGPYFHADTTQPPFPMVKDHIPPPMLRTAYRGQPGIGEGAPVRTAITVADGCYRPDNLPFQLLLCHAHSKGDLWRLQTPTIPPLSQSHSFLRSALPPLRPFSQSPFIKNQS